MKNKINALKAIGSNARKLTTEIAGNYAICVATEPAKKTKRLCVYETAKKLDFTPGAIHQRKLVASFPYANEEQYVAAHKEALIFIAKKQGKIGTEVGDVVTIEVGGKKVKAEVLEVA
jgi:hypothetical protein